MAVVAPIGRVNVDFHVPLNAPTLRAQQEHGIQEIGAGLQVPTAGIDHGEALARPCRQSSGAQMGVGPDALQVPLREVKSPVRGVLPDTVGPANQKSLVYCSRWRGRCGPCLIPGIAF